MSSAAHSLGALERNKSTTGLYFEQILVADLVDMKNAETGMSKGATALSYLNKTEPVQNWGQD